MPRPMFHTLSDFEKLLALLTLVADRNSEGVSEVRVEGRIVKRVKLQFTDEEIHRLQDVVNMSLFATTNFERYGTDYVIEVETTI